MKVLIVDDEANIHRTTAIALEAMGHKPFSAFTGSQALKKLGENKIDTVFLDLRLSNESGLEVYDKIRAEGHKLPIIIFTAYSSIETAIEATRKGVFDYVLKPFVPEQIRQALEKVGKTLSLETKVDELETVVAEVSSPSLFESKDKSMQAIYRLTERAAPSDATVLLLGPSGTGKTVLARRIHNLSQRSSKPFVVVHCPSLSKELLESELFGHVKGSFTGAIKDTWGKIEAADGGTLFLDEIGDLPFEIQAKLLRFLQERQYERVGETKTHTSNVRIVAATNKDLQTEATEGKFREDLFYRLNVISVQVPALKNRPTDVADLAQHFLDHQCRKHGKSECRFSEEAIGAISRYYWPGNLRELNNVVERCFILSQGNEIGIDELPIEVSQSNRDFKGTKNASNLSLGGFFTLKEIEDAHINGVLAATDSYQEAADILDINKTTLYRKRKRDPELELDAS